jgi:hypothetical protein
MTASPGDDATRPGDLAGELRAEMHAFTADLQLPPAVLAGALRAAAAEGRRGRTRLRRSGMMAGGAAVALIAAAAVTVAALTPGAGGLTRPRQAPPARLDAYVLRQARLGTAAGAAGILAARGVGPDGVTWVSYSDQQDGRRSFVQLGPGGQAVTAYSAVTSGRTAMTVVIDYRHHDWWTVPSAAAGEPGADGGQSVLPGLPGTAAQIHAALAAGTLTVTGRQDVGGRDTLRVAVSFGRPGRQLEMWLDPASYLPVRIALAGRSAPPGFYEDLSWLQVSAASRARLAVTPPPGFAHLARPPAGAPGTGSGAG